MRALTALFLGQLPGLAQAQVPANVFSYARVSSFLYETASVPSKGLLKSETIEPGVGNENLCVTTTYGYDGFGNKASATTSNCAGATGLASFTSRTSGSNYGTDGLFPVSSTNALSQSETKAFDARFGALATLTGPNSLTTTLTVDAFGRKTKELRADGTSSVTAYCFVPNLPASIDTTSQSDASDPLSCAVVAPSTAEIPADAFSFIHSAPYSGSTKIGAFARIYSDRQGRVLRTVSEGFDGASQPTTRKLIAQDSFYNAQGAKIGTTQPYFMDATGTSSGSSTTTGSLDRGMSATEYDILGRPTAVYSADANGSQTNVTEGSISISKASVQTFSYQGLTTTTTNDKGQTRIEEKNISGQVIRVTDASGAQLLHQHDAFGNLIETRDALQNKITIAYDARGRKVEMTDPDAGRSTYAYDALGQLVQQQNANQLTSGNPLYGSATTMAYDVLGRMTSRAEPEFISTWTYDTCYKGAGKLCSSTTTNGVTKTLVYDNFGRPINSRADITSGPSLASSVSYDASGRVATQTYPTGVQVGYNYTGLGYLEQLVLKTAATVNPLPATVGGPAVGGTKTLSAGTVLWQAKLVNAWGKTEQSSYGDNVSASNVLSKAVFEAATGRLTALQGGTNIGNDNVFNQSFTWDSLSNLTSRADNIGDGVGSTVTESFAYTDSLNRLTSYTVGAPAIPGSARTVDLQYNALGMLLYKSDVGNYSYPTQGQTAIRPHALQSVAGASTTSYGYDTAGNMTSATGSKYSSVAYTSFNLPDSNTGLRGPGNTPTYTWQYDENHQRIKEIRTNASGTRTTWMLHPDNAGGLGFESEVNAGITSNRHYLSAGGQTIGVLVSTGALPSLTTNQTAPTALLGTSTQITFNKLEYWHKDHLGSLIATTDHAGNVTARYAYDPFGKRRNASGTYDAFGDIVVDWTGNTNNGTDRGFTGHEQLDDIGLVHMNGRIFDANLGRFLQADPLMIAPLNLQNYNRYAYCYNNPLTCTDPTGHGNIFENIVNGAGDLLNHWGDVIRTDVGARIVVAIVVSVATYGYGSDWAVEWLASTETAATAGYTAAEINMAAAVGGGAAAGFSSTFVLSEGDLNASVRAGVTSGIAAGSFSGVDSMTTNWGSAGRVIARATTAGVIGRSQGGNFDESFRSALLIGSAGETYKNYVGWDANLDSGVDQPAGGKTCEGEGTSCFTFEQGKIPLEWKYKNVIGLNERPLQNSDGWFTGLQSGGISRLLNRIPGLNAVAQFHDTIFGGGNISLNFNLFTNVSTMLPAAATSYLAIYDRMLYLGADKCYVCGK